MVLSFLLYLVSTMTYTNCCLNPLLTYTELSQIHSLDILGLVAQLGKNACSYLW